MEIYANSGCGEKMAGYRRLIALCISQRTDQVDGLLEQLYQLFQEEEAQEAGTMTDDVVMVGTE